MEYNTSERYVADMDLVSHSLVSEDRAKFIAASAMALTRYADHDPEFKNILLGPATRATVSVSRRRPHLRPSGDAALLVPEDRVVAQRLLTWMLRYTDGEDGKVASGILADWRFAQDTPSPQAVVLGLKVGILPVGLMGQTKMDETMPIILSEQKLGSKSLMERCDAAVKASNTVLSHAYLSSARKLGDVDPALFEWFLSTKKETRFFTGRVSRIERLVSDLKRLGIAHALEREGSEPLMLAMSPIVHTGTLELFYDLTPVEQTAVA